MKLRIIFLLTVILLPLFSCLTFKYDHIMERFMEFDDFDFNRVKEIVIVSNNRSFSDEMSVYIKTFYRNRGLIKPRIQLTDRKHDGLSHQMEIIVKELDYTITDGWKLNPREMMRNSDGSYVVFHNNVRYWKTISGRLHLRLQRFAELDMVYDITGDFTFTIEEETAAIRTHRDNDMQQSALVGIPSATDLAKNGLRQIDNSRLYHGIIEKVLFNFLSKRLQMISREMVRFQVGYSKEFFKATDFLRKDRLDEALITWQEIYADTDLPSYARGVAAYNIAMIKTMERDYESATIYFNRSEELKQEGMQEIVKY